MTEQNSNTQEIWKPIVGWEAFYAVSSAGRIKRIVGSPRLKAGTCMKTPINVTGYRIVQLYGVGKRRTVYIHRLVAAAFLGACPKGYNVNHKDGDKTNAHVENLEYITQSGNMQHAVKHGLVKIGEENPAAKLSDEKVREIRRLRAQGYSRGRVANQFGVSIWTVTDITTGRRWHHID